MTDVYFPFTQIIAKALELFMISLVTKAASQARAKASRKVTAAHLKQVVQSDEQFDFLADIISRVPDAPTAAKREEDSEGGGGGNGGAGEAKRKRTAPARRRRRRRRDEESE